MQTKCLEEN